MFFTTWGLGQKHWKVHLVAANILKPTLSLVGFGEISGTQRILRCEKISHWKVQRKHHKTRGKRDVEDAGFFVYHLVI